MQRYFLSRPLLLFLLAFSLLVSCRSPQLTGADITVSVTADGASHNITIAAGSTVTQALQSAGITVGELDRVEPPLYTVLSSGNSITLTRVKEVFETVEQTVPFERQVVRNESLHEGETRLVQAGVNGKEELTYRRVLEDNFEISKSIVKSVTLQEAVYRYFERCPLCRLDTQHKLDCLFHGRAARDVARLAGKQRSVSLQYFNRRKEKDPGRQQWRRLRLVGHDLCLRGGWTPRVCAPGWDRARRLGWKISQATARDHTA